NGRLKVCEIIGRLKKQRPKRPGNFRLGGFVRPFRTEHDTRAPIVISTREWISDGSSCLNRNEVDVQKGFLDFRKFRGEAKDARQAGTDPGRIIMLFNPTGKDRRRVSAD